MYTHFRVNNTFDTVSAFNQIQPALRPFGTPIPIPSNTIYLLLAGAILTAQRLVDLARLLSLFDFFGAAAIAQEIRKQIIKATDAKARAGR